jgi:hypothetical protein
MGYTWRMNGRKYVIRNDRCQYLRHAQHHRTPILVTEVLFKLAQFHFRQ